MKRLRLDVDQVQVESFATHNPGRRSGTVGAYADTVFQCSEWTRLPCTDPGETDPQYCIEEPTTDDELSLHVECITLVFPGQGEMTCIPD